MEALRRAHASEDAVFSSKLHMCDEEYYQILTEEVHRLKGSHTETFDIGTESMARVIREINLIKLQRSEIQTAQRNAQWASKLNQHNDTVTPHPRRI